MRILVISDTHIPLIEKTLPAIIKEEIKKSDCCIHAGDFINYEVFKTISALTKIYAVSGNMDNITIINNIPQKCIFQLQDIKIGLIHGKGAPYNLINYINNEFSVELKTIDLFIFGHSHKPYNKEINGKIYFNPGSPTDTIFAPYRSYGILEIENKKIKREIVKIE